MRTTKRRGQSEVQKVAKGGTGNSVLGGLKEERTEEVGLEWRGVVIRGVMVALYSIHVSSATATYRKPIIKLFFSFFSPLHEHLSSDYVKKRTAKVVEKTFPWSLYTLLEYYRYAVSRSVDHRACGNLNNVKATEKRVVASGIRQKFFISRWPLNFCVRSFNMLQGRTEATCGLALWPENYNWPPINEFVKFSCGLCSFNPLFRFSYHTRIFLRGFYH